MESKQTIYILHILYTNSKFSIALPYNSTDLLPANKYSYMLLIEEPVRIKQLIKQDPHCVSVGTQTHQEHIGLLCFSGLI